MQLQQKGYSCGAASLRAALFVHGKVVLESFIRKVAKTHRKEGTDEEGLKRALNRFNFGYREVTTNSSRKAGDWLKKSLDKGRPVLICCDAWDHWITAIGTIGSRIIVFDPANYPRKLKKYSGLMMYGISDLVNRWQFLNNEGYEDKDGFHQADNLTYYYGISVLPEKE